ncbi:MAG: UDP-2,3-diacylglucosamine diphosphatase LpxI [Nitrospirae bacterium]|nr:UDP-2,3-diacylglucosamine diphosphatase LpxI [Nitrospirota bacterium]
MPVAAGTRDQGPGISKEKAGPSLLAIIAGMGDLPKAVAVEAKNMGYRVVGIALQPPADESLKPFVDDFHKINIGRFGGLISLLKKLSITNAVMAGKVPKGLLYKHKTSIIPDMKAVKLLFSLMNRADDTIMKAVVSELEKNGIKLHNTTEFTSNLLAPEGALTKKKPSKDELKDIEFGWDIAKKMGGLDIGQTVVVKELAVMAIEAIEGTDEAIKRGGGLAKKDAVVVKVSKPKQDMRFDVPVVGINTLHSMKSSGAKVLAVEAGKCIIVDKEKFVKEADKEGIIVVGVSRHD